MNCAGCGNDHATSVRGYFFEKQWVESCDRCAGVTAKGSADVYFREAYFDQNLGDAKNPNGQWITSKAHKAKIMREQNVREAGDRKHGSRVDYRPPKI